MMKRNRIGVLLVALLCFSGLAFAQTAKKRNLRPVAKPSPVVVMPDQLKWGPVPSNLEIGTPSVTSPGEMQVAVLAGDPSKPGGLFAIRAKMPDGYIVAPHWHPRNEHVTVLEGTLVWGMGSTFNKAAGREMPAGSYAVVPAHMRHFAWAKGDTTIQVSGVGPFKIIFVPAPRAKAAKSAAK